MKKTSLLVAVPAVLLSALLVSGCGMFRSHKAWEAAQQEAPLEIPPGLDRPSTTAALVIPPPGANQPTANGVTANVGASSRGTTGSRSQTAGSSNQVTDGFVLGDAVDAAYKRVGQALEAGNLGQVVSHDDAAHSYTVHVSGDTARTEKRGFLSRLFRRDKSVASATGAATQQVRVEVAMSGDSGSEVRAQGEAGAVAKVIDGLKASLAGGVTRQ